MVCENVTPVEYVNGVSLPVMTAVTVLVPAMAADGAIVYVHVLVAPPFTVNGTSQPLMTALVRVAPWARTSVSDVIVASGEFFSPSGSLAGTVIVIVPVTWIFPSVIVWSTSMS